MIKLIIILFLTGCSTYPRTRINIVHDYIFTNGIKICENHQGFHYVVAKTVIQSKHDKKRKSNTYPCNEEIKFRCQDGSLHYFDTGVGYCFISESQLGDTNNNIQNPD